MKRAMILGFSVAFGASAWAQGPTPVSVYPGTTVRTRPAGDATPTTVLAPAESPAAPAPLAAPMSSGRTATTPVVTQHPVGPGQFDALQPLGGLLSMPLPTSPTVPAGMCASGACGTPCPPACGAPLFTTVSRDAAGKPRPGFDRVMNWLTWHPGPSVLPVLTPVPYHAPIRAYVACVPEKNPGYPAAAAPCATSHAPGLRLGSAFLAASQPAATGTCANGSCKTRIFNGFGLFAPSSCDAPASSPVGYGCAPVAIPLPPAYATPSQCGHGRSAMDRLIGLFSCGTCCPTGPTTNCR